MLTFKLVLMVSLNILNVTHTHLPCNLKEDYKYKVKNINSCKQKIIFASLVEIMFG